jgi:hypothetical protein
MGGDFWIVQSVERRGYGLADRGSITSRGKRFYSPPYSSNRFWGPPSLLYNVTGALFSGVKRQGREADHSPPSSAEVKNVGVISSLSHMPWWVLLNYIFKYRDNLAFTLIYLSLISVVNYCSV